MGASPMTPVVTIGRFRLFYAERSRFTYPGLHLWTGSRHVRVLPLPRRS